MIDLNADLGEGIADDAAMLAIVSSASIACGGHAGDETTMRSAVRAAMANGVRIGAHPSFVDPEHFGRRRLNLPVEVIARQVCEQVARFAAIAEEEGARLAYVKLHGALANMAAEDEALAKKVFSAIAQDLPNLVILALAESAQERAARQLGLSVIAEAYADRAYTPDGQLAPRTTEGSVIEDEAAIVERCIRLATKGEIIAIDGSVITTTARSICLHGDTPGAVALASAVRKSLEIQGLMKRK